MCEKMFSKKAQTDVKKSAHKILDPKKDIATRFKHLKFLLDNSDQNETKLLFENNYSSIYQIFYESFIGVEANLKQRVTKIHRDELDTILIILEKVLTLCPEIIAQRWQCHSLCMIVTKLLHPENAWRLRRDGMKFFILWYQILGDNAPETINAIFCTLVPGLSNSIPDNSGLTVFWNSCTNPIVLDNISSPVAAVETSILYPPQMGEKQPDDVVKYYLESLLELMVNQVPRIMWKDLKNCQRRCFNFLFEKFKEYYLPVIFPDYSISTNIYKQTTELPDCTNQNRTDINSSSRVCVIKWLAGYTQDIKQKHYYPSIPLISKFIGDKAQIIPFDIVRDTLYKSRENVNLIHEIFRQAFLLNFTWAIAIRRTIAVYKDWIQLSVEHQPPFMLEPEEINVQTSDLNCYNEEIPQIKYEPKYGDIRAGFQNVIQMFMSNALQVFISQNGTHPILLEEQVDICKRVLNIYRYMVMHTYMTLKTWEQLLNVLLRITTLVLNKKPPKRKEDTLSGKLAPAIFQTLIVTWIKANLNVPISEKLWNQFLKVLCSLTQWEELIREWSKTLETLTRVLARHVYGLDLADLPLERILDKKSRKKRGCTILNSAYNICNLSHSQVNQQRGSVIDSHSDNTIKKRQFIKRSNSDSDITYCYLFQKYSETDSVFNITETPTADDIKYSWKDDKSLKCLFNVRKCHSLENLTQLLMLRMRDTHSRSPSPVPSAGMESNLFKDTNIQIEIMSSQHPSSEKITNKKSVMSGGEVRGWTPDVAAILWRRMLSALGDVNLLENPILHERVFQYLLDLNETMTKIYQNRSMVEEDNYASSDLVPPILIIAPWCFQALNLPKTYRNGKLHAYKLLCQMTLNNNKDVSLGQKYVTQFFKVLHYGLTSSDQDIVNTILKNTGPQFFSHQLPGFTLLTLDFVRACNEVLSGTNFSMAPRAEAVSILGTLLCFPANLTKVPYLKPDCHQFLITYCPDIKDTVITIMLKVAKREPSGLARCISLSNLGIFVCQELSKPHPFHPSIKEAIITLLLALQFKNEKISQVACDNVMLLCDYVPILLIYYPDIPPKVLEVLSATLSNMLPIGDRNKRLLTSLVFCLAEWTMRLPISTLLEIRSKQNLSMTVFMVIDALSRTCNEKTIESLKKATEVNLEYANEFTFDITLDNLKTGESTRNMFSDHNTMAPTHLNSTRHSLQIATKMIINHLLNNLGQFPMLTGRLCSMVSEHDDVLNSVHEQVTVDIFSVPKIQLFMSITNMLTISIIELPTLEFPGGGITACLRTGFNQVRVIQRDLVGKSCWDISLLYCSPESEPKNDDNLFITKSIYKNNETEESILICNSNCQIEHTLRHRIPNVLPTFENSADDLDNLDDLLQFIGFTSSECLEDLEILLNNPAIKSPMTLQLEQDVMSTILGQHFLDNNYTEKLNTVLCTHMEKRPKSSVHKSPFQTGRALFSELGFTNWDQRKQIYQLERNEKVLRELRNLDAQYCRDTHKIAIIYVAEGQEDKFAIISNTGGSQAYEEFISALAWEVELETHNGFMGGLQRNKNAGSTTPYYSTSFIEVVFHVATRMATTSTQEAYVQKTRHLGNDEVHIVWSENSKDYRRGIIPTEFCDILIVIYPLPNSLFRIQVSRKPEVPYFGPLYNEVIVQKSILANVVRHTAINASCAKRSTIPFYQQYYEERWLSLDLIMKKYRHSGTFEEFISNVYSPVQTTSPFQQSYFRSNSEKYKPDDYISGSNNLAAVLIDSCQNRNVKGLPIDWSKKNGTDVDVLISAGISPRPHKKLTSHQNLMR
ncbi:Hypothetical protein CINCED_3A022064 [Cinara cedri]|uniref:Rap-GAP domain-containing protein n=1 Tax=Cinara cedri TaxID=506608 RepID=A0A5E4MX01_9HEMI|nr:Hypothetical protein CINCED_3A022064 [Cinara cedri]